MEPFRTNRHVWFWYADMIQEDKFVDKLLINRWYGEGHGNLHKMYILEIQHIYVK